MSENEHINKRALASKLDIANIYEQLNLMQHAIVQLSIVVLDHVEPKEDELKPLDAAIRGMLDGFSNAIKELGEQLDIKVGDSDGEES